TRAHRNGRVQTHPGERSLPRASRAAAGGRSNAADPAHRSQPIVARARGDHARRDDHRERGAAQDRSRTPAQTLPVRQGTTAQDGGGRGAVGTMKQTSRKTARESSTAGARIIARSARAAALLALAGCSGSDSKATVRDAGDNGHSGLSSSRDAAPRVKPRTVAIELPPVATREVSQGPDGAPVYGEITQLDDAD